MTKKASIVDISGYIDRSVGSLQVTIPTEYAGDTLEVYLAFQNADGTAVSNSDYLGSVNVD